MEELCYLVTNAQAGNQDACNALANRFQAMAYATARRYIHDYYLAQDVVQEALIEAFVHLPQLKEPHAFPGWFQRIVFHQCTRILRRSSLESVPLDVAETVFAERGCPQQITMKRETQTQVRQAILSLPAHERSVAALFYLSHYSLKEVSSQLNVPVTTIKKRLYSARQRLKARLLLVAQENGAVIAEANASNPTARNVIRILLRFIESIGVERKSPWLTRNSFA